MPPSLLLNDAEILRVLASTCICYAAFDAGGTPYVLPLGFALMADGSLHLRLAYNGRAAAALRSNAQVCLAFSLLDERWVDSVLAEGRAALSLAETNGSLKVSVQIQQLSGRRFPLAGAW